MPSHGAFETPWRAAAQRHATDTCPCRATTKGLLVIFIAPMREFIERSPQCERLKIIQTRPL
jgi:hypothetical protein